MASESDSIAFELIKLLLILVIFGSFPLDVSASDSESIISPQKSASYKADSSFSPGLFYADARPPSTPIDVLKNVKIALDNDLLIKNEFFTDKNIRVFFGSEKIDRYPVESSSDRIERISLSNFNVFPHSAPPDNTDANSIEVRLDQSFKDENIVCSIVAFHFSGELYKSIPSFENIVELFGKNWKEDNRQELENEIAFTREPFNPKLTQKTHRMGYAVIIYASNDSDVKRYSQFTFSFNGSLREAIINEGKECLIRTPVQPSVTIEPLKLSNPAPVNNYSMNAEFEAIPDSDLTIEYPPMSRRLREVGQVDFMLAIRSDGSVSDIKIIKEAMFPRLTEAVNKSAKNWKFRSTTLPVGRQLFWSAFRAKFNFDNGS